MRAARYATVGILALVSVAAGCINTAELRDLQGLASAINSRYEAPAGVNLTTGGQLTITFQNSKYAALAPAAREAFARGVARFAVAHFPERDSLRVVRVGFQSVKGMAGFSVTRSEVPYSWSLADLRSIPDSGTPAVISAQRGARRRAKR